MQTSIALLIDGDAVLTAVAKKSPALIAALATQFGSAADNQKALELVRSGHIRDAENVFGLPLWYRHLNVTAFAQGIPIMPYSERFEELIPALIPADTANYHAVFLQSATTALMHADENFFLWLASQMQAQKMVLTERQTALLAVYATFSALKSAPATQYMQHPWTPQMSLKIAASMAKAWFNWMVFVCITPDARLADTWRRGGTFHGFEIKELTTPLEVLQAADALRNCSYQYAAALMTNNCRLFSVNRGGGIVAMFDLYSNGDFLVPNQIKGFGNEPVLSDVHRAVYAFLAESTCSEDGTGMPRRVYRYEKPAAVAHRWTQLSAPYVQARGYSKYLPTKATTKTLGDFVSDTSKSLSRIAEGWEWRRIPLLRRDA